MTYGRVVGRREPALQCRRYDDGWIEPKLGGWSPSERVLEFDAFEGVAAAEGGAGEAAMGGVEQLGAGEVFAR